jgi:hypothetical protein
MTPISSNLRNALREQGGGHPWHAAADIVETAAAAKKLTHNQRCPELAEYPAPRATVQNCP